VKRVKEKNNLNVNNNIGYKKIVYVKFSIGNEFKF
jgi:hypothetical protein